MKHKTKNPLKNEKRSLFAENKAIGQKDISSDKKIRRKIRRKSENRPYSIEEMMLYDEIFDEWDE